MEYIVAYTSSREEEDTSTSGSSHGVHPPPHASARNKSDASDGSYHQGRIRSFPHVEGQFATHVYFELTGGEDNTHLGHLLQAFSTLGETFHPMEQPFHVSLSRTVAITSIQMKSLLSELKNALQKPLVIPRKRPRTSILDMSLRVRIGESACILVNDEKTRTFLSLSVSMQGRTSLESVIGHVSRVFQRHGLPEYYQDPNIHTSVGWCLGNQEVEMKRLLEKSQKYLGNLAWSCSLTRILCRIGKKDHIVWSSVCR